MQGLAFATLLLEFGVVPALFVLDFGQFGGAFAGVLGECLLLPDGGLDLAHQFSLGTGDGGQVIEIACQLARVVAVEQQLQ